MNKWTWNNPNGQRHRTCFVSPTGKTFYRLGYSATDAETLCKHLNARPSFPKFPPNW